jgi:hypothetical protein
MNSGQGNIINQPTQNIYGKKQNKTKFILLGLEIDGFVTANVT